MEILYKPSAYLFQKPRPLPIRTSPIFDARTPSFSYRVPPRSVPATLTPVESSDEEPCNINDAEDEGMNVGSTTDLPSSQTSKTSSMNVGVGEDEDLDMTDSQTRSPPPWHAQVTLSPSRPQSSFLNLPINPSGGRIPTPIYGHFTNDFSMDMSGQSTPANGVTTIREEDDWWRRRDLPSPASDHDNGHPMMSPIGETDGLMGRLNVGTGTRAPDSSSADSIHPMFSHREDNHQTGRSSRLVMGYRADCDKCRQKVPGHYSHIVRY